MISIVDGDNAITAGPLHPTDHDKCKKWSIRVIDLLSSALSCGIRIFRILVPFVSGFLTFAAHDVNLLPRCMGVGVTFPCLRHSPFHGPTVTMGKATQNLQGANLHFPTGRQIVHRERRYRIAAIMPVKGKLSHGVAINLVVAATENPQMSLHSRQCKHSPALWCSHHHPTVWSPDSYLCTKRTASRCSQTIQLRVVCPWNPLHG